MSRDSFSQAELATLRRAFARQLVVGADAAEDVRLERAIAATAREAFLGPAPRWAFRWTHYQQIPTDPALVYQDILIGIAPDKGINNGQPSLHTHWLHAAAVKPGETIVHIGAGAGYYTAILASLTGARGRVTAVEFDPALADMARANLAARRNVKVVQGDGGEWPHGPCDFIYVNFAVDRPSRHWLERLKPGGRLIFPLGTLSRETAKGPAHGIGLRVEHVGVEGVFAARSLGNALFIRAAGSGLLAGSSEREALLSAFERGGADSIRSLRWGVAPSPGGSWHVGAGWSLSDETP